MTHILAKVGGWGFFGLTLLQQFATQHPHGFSDWMQLLGAGVAAVMETSCQGRPCATAMRYARGERRAMHAAEHAPLGQHALLLRALQPAHFAST
jgi:hypothetical protein